MRVLIGILLVAHGLIHIAIYSSPAHDARAQAAFKLGHSWILSPAGLGDAALKIVGMPLWVAAGVGFALAGLAVFGVLPIAWWQALAVTAAISSLALFTVFWHPWIVAAFAVDVAVLVGLLVVSPPWVEQIAA